jgi:hypothetical protein
MKYLKRINEHAKNSNQLYNGYQARQLNRFFYSSGQFLMTLAAINKLSKEDSKYKSLAEEGNKLKEPIVKFVEIVGTWSNGRKQFKIENNHYNNIQFSLNRYDNEMVEHDKYVINDIQNDVKINCKFLIEIMEFIRDSEFENEGNLEDLQEFAELIESIKDYIEILKQSDLYKYKLWAKRKINFNKSLNDEDLLFTIKELREFAGKFHQLTNGEIESVLNSFVSVKKAKMEVNILTQKK